MARSYSGVRTGKYVIYKEKYSQPGTWVVSGALTLDDATVKLGLLEAKADRDTKYSIHAEVEVDA